MEYYKNQTHWKLIQPFLPKKNRLSRENLPKECFWKWNNHMIHIDMYTHKNPKARVILLHGVGGNGRLLSFIALPLFENGIDVICPDMPLYGNTVTKGDITYNTWINCIASLLKCKYKDDIPTFVFGLSAGGMLAYQVAIKCKHVKGVIATCMLDQSDPYIMKRIARNKCIGTIGSPLINSTHKTFRSVKVPMKLIGNMKKITNNKSLSRVLNRDKKSSGAKVPLGFVHSMINMKVKVPPERFNNCPVLLVHPEKDKWTDISLSKMFFDKLGGRKYLKILTGAGHFPIEPRGLSEMEKHCINFINKYK